jgi:hypothetical protein
MLPLISVILIDSALSSTILLYNMQESLSFCPKNTETQHEFHIELEITFITARSI